MTEQTQDMTSRERVDFYVKTARVASQLLESGDTAPESDESPRNYTEALEWLEARHAKLIAAQRVAAEHGWHDQVWALAGVLTAYHHRRGNLHELIAPWQAALVAAEHIDDSDYSAVVTAHRLLGDTYAATGWHEEAAVHLKKALELAERYNDLEMQGHTHFIFGIACERREDDDEALEHYRRAQDLFHETGNVVWEATALDAVAGHEADAGEYDQAREHSNAALALHREHSNPAGEARALNSLAFIHRETDQHAEAVDHYQRALAIFRELGHSYEIASTLGRLGTSYAALGDKDKARTAWNDAREMHLEQNRDRAVREIQEKLDGLDSDED